MAFVSNGTTILDAGAFSASLGSMTLIKTITLSSAAGTVSFVHGASDVVLDSTYPVYKFVYTSVHPAEEGAIFQVGFRDGSSSYDATKTTTIFEPIANEGDTSAEIAYQPAQDLAQSTNFQTLLRNNGNANDECGSGEMLLFNPSSTTFVKHFLARGCGHHQSDYTYTDYVAGYCNVTAAIDAVQFKFHSDNIDAGTFKLYGIKDS